MRKILSTVTAVVFMAAWSAITIFAVPYGAFYNWPDYVHTDYGLPLAWATHTTSTFAGPADLWTVNVETLAVDLAVWLAIMVAIVVLIQVAGNRVKSPAVA